jgi:hypothetical protein
VLVDTDAGFRYYETQGFKSIGDFEVEEKDNWHGAVFEMRL